MKAYVYVSLKKSVLDPQGKTIHGALKKMGYKGLEEVRQGKYFELTLDGGLSREEAQSEVERINRFQVQVIGGLVERQEIRLLQHQAAEDQPRRFAA